MKATDLDVDVTCPVCNGDGDEPGDANAYEHCPRCGGSGTINRYADGPADVVILAESFVDHGTHVRHAVTSMPI